MFYSVVHILSITMSVSTVLLVYARVQTTKENKTPKNKTKQKK